ncbi:hypothetical protein D3C79_884320 [compost metagenome]
MLVQVAVGNRRAGVQLQHDLVQLFQRLDLAILGQLRDLVDGHVFGLGQARCEGQGGSSEQSGQGFHEVLSLGELSKWDQINCGNLIHA